MPFVLIFHIFSL